MKKVIIIVALAFSFPFFSMAHATSQKVSFPATYFTGTFDGDSQGYFAGKISKNKITFLLIDTDMGGTAKSSATINSDGSFQGKINYSASTHSIFSGQISTNPDGSIQILDGTWSTYYQKFLEYSGSFTAAPMANTFVNEGAGVWFGSCSAKVYDPDWNKVVPVTGLLGLITYNDGTIVEAVAYKSRGQSGSIQFTGTWQPETGLIQIDPDPYYGIWGQGQIKNTKISGLLYQETAGAIKIGKWVASKL